MQRVYLAGKALDFHGRNWREPLIPDFGKGCTMNHNWCPVMTCVPDVVCIGPFVQAEHGFVYEDAHGRTEPDPVHRETCETCWGIDRCQKYERETVERARRQREIYLKCIRRVQECDGLFVNLSDPTCHGTLWEMGYAARKAGQNIVTWNAHPDLWFACEMSSVWNIPGPNDEGGMTLVEAFKAACKHWGWCAPPEPPGDSPIEKAFAAEWYRVHGSFPQSQAQLGAHRVDFLVGRTVIELDGHEFHKTKEARTADAARDRTLTLAGYRVIRFTGSEVHADVAGCVRQAFELSKA